MHADNAEARLREAIVAAGARLRASRLVVAAEGNLSVRLADGRILVTPTGRRKDELAPEELVVVPVERPARGDSPDGRGLGPTSDIAIHRAIYRARPDVTAVVHAHVPAAMALTLAGEWPDPAALPETALLLPRLPLVPFATMGSDELAAAVVAALLEPPDQLPRAVLLERHGAVSVAGPSDAAEARAAHPDDVQLAVDRIELVDVLCRVWLDAALVRGSRGAP